jgi:hypothetical protein
VFTSSGLFHGTGDVLNTIIAAVGAAMVLIIPSDDPAPEITARRR